MNSARVLGSLSKAPRIELVMAKAFCWATPRIIMHRWIASTTTATPLGSSTFSSVSAISRGEALLHLQAPAEHLDQARDLGEPHHLAVRQVGDVRAPEERQHVVLAEAVEVDVLHDHHLVVADVEERVVEDLPGILRVAGAEEAHRLGDADRRAQQAVAAGVLAELLQQLRDQGLDRIAVAFAHSSSPYTKELRLVSTTRTRASRAVPARSIAGASSAWITCARFSAVGTRSREGGIRVEHAVPEARRDAALEDRVELLGVDDAAAARVERTGHGDLDAVVVAVPGRIGALAVDPRGSARA